MMRVPGAVKRPFSRAPTKGDPPLIESYSEGRFRFGRMIQQGSLLLLPGGAVPWRVADVGQISFEALKPLLRACSNNELVLLGTGETGVMPPGAVLDTLAHAGLGVEAMSTAAACRTYNALVVEGRAVAAALIAVR